MKTLVWISQFCKNRDYLQNAWSKKIQPFPVGLAFFGNALAEGGWCSESGSGWPLEGTTQELGRQVMKIIGSRFTRGKRKAKGLQRSSIIRYQKTVSKIIKCICIICWALNDHTPPPPSTHSPTQWPDRHEYDCQSSSKKMGVGTQPAQTQEPLTLRVHETWRQSHEFCNESWVRFWDNVKRLSPGSVGGGHAANKNGVRSWSVYHGFPSDLFRVCRKFNMFSPRKKIR